MKILIYSMNYYPELTGIGKYSGEMATWFQEKGHTVKVVTAPPYYPHWKVDNKYRSFSYQRETINGVQVHRCPLYVPKTPTTITRLLHLFSFSFTSSFSLFKQLFWKPNVVITVNPTMFCTPAAICFSKLSRAKSILHIQDFELDAMLGLGMSKEGHVAGFAKKIESKLMSKFDMVSSISYSMVNLANKKMSVTDKAIYFPNWVDVDFITPSADRKIFLKKWNIPASKKVILYSGNLGKKQGLEIVLHAAKCMKENDDVLFVIVGTGAAKNELTNQAKKLNLNNVLFHPLQDYKDLPALMALADIHLVIQKKGAANAVLPSKLTTILSAGGTAIITAEKEAELGLFCRKNPSVAYCVEPEEPELFTAKLQSVISTIDVSNRKHNEHARLYAKEYLEKNHVLEHFEQAIVDMLESNKAANRLQI